MRQVGQLPRTKKRPQTFVKHGIKMHCPEALSSAEVPAHCSAIKASNLHENTKRLYCVSHKPSKIFISVWVTSNNWHSFTSISYWSQDCTEILVIRCTLVTTLLDSRKF